MKNKKLILDCFYYAYLATKSNNPSSPVKFFTGFIKGYLTQPVLPKGMDTYYSLMLIDKDISDKFAEYINLLKGE